MHFIKFALVDFAIYRIKCGVSYQPVNWCVSGTYVTMWALPHKVVTPSCVKVGLTSQSSYSVLCESGPYVTM